MGESLKDQL